jgi:hypothetical protein
MKKNLSKVGVLAAALSPLLLMAQDTTPITNLIDGVKTVVDTLVPILMTIALLYFIWGLIKYIIAAGKGNDAEAKQGKAIMIWGIVALFVMASVWGLTGLLSRIFGVNNGQAPSASELRPRP